MKVSLGTLGTWVVVLALGAGAYAWWQRPTPVETTQATTRPLVRTLQFTARVATPARVDLGTTLTGRVARVLVDEGDAMRAGAPLIELETDEARAAASQADASLKQAEATLRAAERDLARTQELVAQQFFPSSNRPELMVDLWLPRGASYAATCSIASVTSDDFIYLKA